MTPQRHPARPGNPVRTAPRPRQSPNVGMPAGGDRRQTQPAWNPNAPLPELVPSPMTMANPAWAQGPKPKLRIYALGGLEEIGRNCTVFECGDDIVIVDCGLLFPNEAMPGIDYIIPNVSALKGKEKNIRGIVVTHGHLDHIGGLPLVMAKLGWPIIYTSPLTGGLIKKRQEEFGGVENLKIHNVDKHDTKIALGTNFIFEPFHVNHNIADAFGAALHTPHGTILVTGDFKFDFTPVNDEPADLMGIAKFGLNGALLLMQDSTNAESPGHQLSEKKVGEELDKIVAGAKGRLIVSMFSSHLTRLQQMLAIAEKYGRKVLLEGRSMNQNVELARSLGYMYFRPDTVIEEGDARRLPDDKIMVLCTGSQGEKNAVLMRIANNEHRYLRIQPGDGIVFSSSVIPGNERSVEILKDSLIKQGARVYHNNNMDIHAGGHAKQEDLKLMIRLTKPKFFMPIHGNPFRLIAHATLAREAGIPASRIFVVENGQVVEIDEQGNGRATDEKMDTSYVMVDGLGVGDVAEIVLRDRVALAEDGFFVVIVKVDKQTGAMMGKPEIVSRGFTQSKDTQDLLDRANAKVTKALAEHDPKSGPVTEHLQNKLREVMGQFLFQETKRRPMILPVILEV
jgi:ribonuclease J